MNKEFIFLIVKDKEYKSKNRKVNINLESTNRMDCMFIFKYKHTIDLKDLCLDQNRLIENFLFNKLHRIVKYLFQSYVIKINKINQNIIINKLDRQMKKNNKFSRFKNSKIAINLIIVFNKMDNW